MSSQVVWMRVDGELTISQESLDILRGKESPEDIWYTGTDDPVEAAAEWIPTCFPDSHIWDYWIESLEMTQGTADFILLWDTGDWVGLTVKDGVIEDRDVIADIRLA